jgi:hypothetical protein
LPAFASGDPKDTATMTRQAAGIFRSSSLTSGQDRYQTGDCAMVRGHDDIVVMLMSHFWELDP